MRHSPALPPFSPTLPPQNPCPEPALPNRRPRRGMPRRAALHRAAPASTYPPRPNPRAADLPAAIQPLHSVHQSAAPATDSSAATARHAAILSRSSIAATRSLPVGRGSVLDGAVGVGPQDLLQAVLRLHLSAQPRCAELQSPCTLHRPGPTSVLPVLRSLVALPASTSPLLGSADAPRTSHHIPHRTSHHRTDNLLTGK